MFSQLEIDDQSSRIDEPQSAQVIDDRDIHERIAAETDPSVDHSVSDDAATDSLKTSTEISSDVGQSDGTNFVDVPADTWFALAHWAKEHDCLTPWDRKFTFSQGIRVNKGNEASEKQASVCERILREARELGFSENGAS